MNSALSSILLVVLTLALPVRCLVAQPTAQSPRARLIILADMGNEPDEEQQMLHMLACCNEFEVEGLIAVTGKYLRPEHKVPYRQKLHPELFTRLIDGYAKVYPNLKLHAAGWPTPEHLHGVVASGQTGYGIAATGEGKASAGSKLIIDAVTKADARPMHIVVNAGANTLAQALRDYRATHTAAELKAFVARLRVFENGAQDNSGAWICHEFPDIFWVRSNYQTYCFGGPSNKELGPHNWKPYPYSPDGQDAWTAENVRTNHGALGELYPVRSMGKQVHFLEGGGTIPWMGLVCHGLTDSAEPSWGGWSGRFSAERLTNVWSRHSDIKTDEQACLPFSVFTEVKDRWTDPDDGKVYDNSSAAIWRWRIAMWNDFKARMDWCVQPYAKANHHPVAAFNGDTSDTIVRLKALAGATLAFDASASSDPDGDKLSYSWWQYEEAGTYPGRVFIEHADAARAKARIPTGAGGKQIHIILEVRDQNPIASLHDYRRVVIDVENRIIELDLVQKPSPNLASDAKGLPADPGKAAVLWEIKVGTHQYSIPTLDRGRIYIGANDASFERPGYKPTRGGALYCVEQATGKLIWQLASPRYFEGVKPPLHFDQWGCGICSGPVVDGNRVYVVGNRGEILCLDGDGQANGNDGPFKDEQAYMGITNAPGNEPRATDGDIIWKYNLLSELDVVPHDVSGSTLLLQGDYVYACTSNGLDDRHAQTPRPLAPSLIVLDKTTGRLVATDAEQIGQRLLHCHWSSPSAGRVNGKPLIFFGGGDGVLYAFQPPQASPDSAVQTLKKVWAYDCNPPEYRKRDGKALPYSNHTKNSPEGPSEIIGIPVFYQGRVYVAIGQSPVHGNGRGCLSCVDAATGAKVWTSELIERSLATATIADGLLYIPDCTGNLHCFDVETGNRYWVHPLGAKTWGASAFVADDKVYIGTEANVFWVLQAGKTLRVLSRTRMQTVPITPIAAPGVLYIPTQNKLTALAAKPGLPEDSSGPHQGP